MAKHEEVIALRWIVDGDKPTLQFARKEKVPGRRSLQVVWHDVPAIMRSDLEDAGPKPRDLTEPPEETAAQDTEPLEYEKPLFEVDKLQLPKKDEEPVSEVTQPEAKPVTLAPELPEVDTEVLHAAWSALSFEERAAAKAKYGSALKWYLATESKRQKEKPTAAQSEPPREASRQEFEEYVAKARRVYGSDARDVRVFLRLSPSERADVLSRWPDQYAWYLCEHTNIIAAGLREGMAPERLAKHYKLRIEEVKRVTPLPG